MLLYNIPLNCRELALYYSRKITFDGLLVRVPFINLYLNMDNILVIFAKTVEMVHLIYL